MELDLLAAAETESDSESNHSNQDNASGRRSVVTAATAGSEAGVWLHLAATSLVCHRPGMGALCATCLSVYGERVRAQSASPGKVL